MKEALKTRVRKKPCHLCGKRLSVKDLKWYNSEGSTHIPTEVGDWGKERNFQSYLKSEFTIFLCADCESAHDIEGITDAIPFLSWAWQYDVTGKVPAVYFDRSYYMGTELCPPIRMDVTPDLTPDEFLSQFTTLYGYELTFEKLALVLAPKSLQFFKRKIRGKLKRLQKQWKDREAIREKKDEQRKGKIREIARYYAEVPPDVIPALVRISGKDPRELRKIAEFVECLAGRQYWQDQKMHREAAELSKVIKVMDA